ncbi:hypothetical protein B0H12DRAFT_1143564 [Mycena haematopus]|nr:hypothetical protein B0H12DRAFT_1143564 [Mycena haematopus]
MLFSEIEQTSVEPLDDRSRSLLFLHGHRLLRPVHACDRGITSWCLTILRQPNEDEEHAKENLDGLQPVHDVHHRGADVLPQSAVHGYSAARDKLLGAEGDGGDEEEEFGGERKREGGCGCGRGRRLGTGVCGDSDAVFERNGARTSTAAESTRESLVGIHKEYTEQRDGNTEHDRREGS